MRINTIRMGCLLAFSAVQVLYAQLDTGAIAGAVKDSSGAVLQAAKVTIIETETAIAVSLLTNNDGFYSAPALHIGHYNVSVSAAGFATETRKGIELRVQDRLNIDFTLSPGQTNTIVTVEGGAPLLQTEDTSMGAVVDDATMQNLPLNGRNYIQLATLGAGTSPSRRGAERDTFIANGARELQNTYLLDGVDNKNKIVGFDSSAAQAIEPVIDGVQEFKVETSTFSAEYGQAAGAVVNVTLKSGTNQYHGSMWEYIRNSFFDAKPFFQVLGQKPDYNLNQFGATFGGPIIKDRTFFFGSWQSLRAVDEVPQQATVPTLAQRSGVFSTTIYDPNSTVANPNGSGYVRTPFPHNTIPASDWDTVSAQLLPLYPLPNLTGSSNYFSDQKERLANDQYNFRLDHRFNDKDTFFARYSRTEGENILPAPLPPPASNPSDVWPDARSVAASETHIFRANLINELRFGYMETREIQQVPGINEDAEFGITGAPNYPEVHGLPTFAISGLNTLGTTGPGALPLGATGSGNLPLNKQGKNQQFFDNLSWVKGRHTLKFGVDIEQVMLYGYVTLSARPAFTFTGVFTQNPQSRSGTGAAFADFLLGEVNQLTVSTRPINWEKQHTAEGYVQDDWKVSPKLTVNLGLRYELAMPWYEIHNDFSDFILQPGPAYGLLVTAPDASQYGLRNSFATPDTKNFAPRAGLAYQLTPKTVIRSGFGVFYGRTDENLGISSRPTNNPPYFLRSINTSDQIHTLMTLEGGIPPNLLNPNDVINANVNSWPIYMPLPYTFEWNLNLQQQLGSGFTAQVGYVGSSSHNLYVDPNFNQPQPGPGSIASREPFPEYSSILAYLPLDRSNYNSLIAQLERRFKSGFSFLGAYTWSHSFDYGGQVSDSTDYGPQNPYNWTSNYGSSNFDVRQRVSASYIYELPFGRGKALANQPGVARAILGGWQLSGVTSFQTGLPFTPILSFDPTNTGTTAHPNVVPGKALYPTNQGPSDWFNGSAFVAPAAYTYGNAGRNFIRGPGSFNSDVGLLRSGTIKERYNVQFSAQAFNVFNTPQFGLPNNTIGVSTTGVITTVVTPERQLQLGLHFQF
ncbi:MAG TPA: TonB-dependent receptor [Bryobacteraceae bacterium]|nr:TonB-dependent receptor [Bryobacteraceae bacterium]